MSKISPKVAHILLVEDEKELAELFALVLNREGFLVTTVQTAAAAFSALNEIKEQKLLRPDIILLDLLLPDGSGIDVLKKIRSDFRRDELRVFIFSNYTNPDTNTELSRIGIEKFLLKSDYNPDDLVAFLKKELENVN